LAAVADFWSFANMSVKLSIIVLAGGLIVVSALICFGRKYYDYSQYVCMNCGLTKSEDIGKFGSLKYRNTRRFEDTAVSTALQATNCSHTWLLYRFGRGSGHLFRGWQVHADGGSRAYMIPFLLKDQGFASDLAAMPRASMVWSNLFVAVDTSRDLNDSLSTWWQEGSDRGSFSNWWDRVSHTGAGRRIGEPVAGGNSR
jgi:hypothetical protein